MTSTVSSFAKFELKKKGKFIFKIYNSCIVSGFVADSQ